MDSPKRLRELPIYILPRCVQAFKLKKKKKKVHTVTEVKGLGKSTVSFCSPLPRLSCSALCLQMDSESLLNKVMATEIHVSTSALTILQVLEGPVAMGTFNIHFP